MEVKIRIQTVPGEANKVQKRMIKFFKLGNVKNSEVFINDNDSEILWVVEDSFRKIMGIQQRVLMWDQLMTQVLDNKYLKKIAKKKLSDEDMANLKDMLENQTNVEIIKPATEKETIKILQKNDSWWEKIKHKFK